MKEGKSMNEIREDVIGTINDTGSIADRALLAAVQIVESEILELHMDVKELKIELLSVKKELNEFKEGK